MWRETSYLVSDCEYMYEQGSYGFEKTFQPKRTDGRHKQISHIVPFLGIEYGSTSVTSDCIIHCATQPLQLQWEGWSMSAMQLQVFRSILWFPLKGFLSQTVNEQRL